MPVRPHLRCQADGEQPVLVIIALDACPGAGDGCGILRPAQVARPASQRVVAKAAGEVQQKLAIRLPPTCMCMELGSRPGIGTDDVLLCLSISALTYKECSRCLMLEVCVPQQLS